VFPAETKGSEELDRETGIRQPRIAVGGGPSQVGKSYNILILMNYRIIDVSPDTHGVLFIVVIQAQKKRRPEDRRLFGVPSRIGSVG
jgi:hypothetical protein